ncbi:hypothetical protein AGDE_16710 [Angomonas deanei]|nr:hypothetical protein AGDE_16710 [Angomonas deanei]|eukprot:EPY16566.1 hypothetical protein AGDE_16710 [Angomonas deanei]
MGHSSSKPSKKEKRRKAPVSPPVPEVQPVSNPLDDRPKASLSNTPVSSPTHLRRAPPLSQPYYSFGVESLLAEQTERAPPTKAPTVAPYSFGVDSYYRRFPAGREPEAARPTEDGSVASSEEDENMRLFEKRLNTHLKRIRDRDSAPPAEAPTLTRHASVECSYWTSFLADYKSFKSTREGAKAEAPLLDTLPEETTTVVTGDGQAPEIHYIGKIPYTVVNGKYVLRIGGAPPAPESAPKAVRKVHVQPGDPDYEEVMAFRREVAEKVYRYNLRKVEYVASPIWKALEV